MSPSSYSLKSHVKNEHMVLRCKEEGCSFATKSALLMDNHMVDTHQKAVKVSHRGLSLPKGFLGKFAVAMVHSTYLNYVNVGPYFLQCSAKRRAPGCVNAAGKARQKW